MIANSMPNSVYSSDHGRQTHQNAFKHFKGKANNVQNAIREPMHGINHIFVKLNGRKIHSLIDTGSNATCISSKLAKQFKLEVHKLQKNSSNTYWAANNTEFHVLGTTKIDINLQGLFFHDTAFVVERLSDSFIIGAQSLLRNRAVIDYQNEVVSLAEDMVQLPTVSCDKRGNYVHSIKITIVLLMCEADVRVQLPHKFVHKDIIFEPRFTNGTENFAVARTVKHPETSITTCRVLVVIWELHINI